MTLVCGGDMGRDAPRRGQSLVEFALVLPVLVILLLGLLDLGRLFYAYVGVTGAAGEGAAHGARIARDPDMDHGQLLIEVEARTIEASDGLVQIEEGTVEVAPDEITESSDSITVTLTYDFELITPLVRRIVSGGVLSLRAVAVRDIGPG
jgi:hypothetical protein